MSVTTSPRLNWVSTGSDRVGFVVIHPAHGELAHIMLEPTDTAQQKWSWVVYIGDYSVRGISTSARKSALAAEAAISDEYPGLLEELVRPSK